MDIEDVEATKREEALEGTLAATVVPGREQRDSPAPPFIRRVREPRS